MKKTFLASLTSLWVAVIALTPTVQARQDPSKVMDPTPRKTDFFTPTEFNARQGDKIPAPTAKQASTLPFAVDKNFPSFYIIPPSKRPSILNQGSFGTCVAYATSVAVSTILANQPKAGLVPPMAVPDPLPFYIAAGRTLTGPSAGWSAFSSPNRMVTTGAPLALTIPNALDNGISRMGPLSGYWIKAGKEGVINDDTPRPAGVSKHDVMRKFLATQGALLANFTVYNDFNRYESGVYNHPKFVDLITAPLDAAAKLPGSSSTLLDTKKKLTDSLNAVSGSHAVAVIGYFVGGKLTGSQLASIMGFEVGSNVPSAVLNIRVDAPPFWIVQNSWGSNWGIKGIFLYEVGQSLPNPLDDAMAFMLDPIVTFNGKQILPMGTDRAVPASATKIKLKSASNGQYLCASDGLQHDKWLYCKPGTPLTFVVEGNLDSCSLRVDGTNLYFSYADRTGAVKLWNTNDAAQFKLERQSNGTYAIKNLKYNQYIWLDKESPYLTRVGNPAIPSGRWTIEGLP